MYSGISNAEIKDIGATAPVVSGGGTILPFGNESERVHENKSTGARIEGINFNNHTRANLLRAAQEGIVFSFIYGIEIMKEMGLDVKVLKAGYANMFLSPLFRETLASTGNVAIELYDTDGAAGAARGAGIGAGIYKDAEEAFSNLEKISTILPDTDKKDQYLKAYNKWKEVLDKNNR